MQAEDGIGVADQGQEITSPEHLFRGDLARALASVLEVDDPRRLGQIPLDIGHGNAVQRAARFYDHTHREVASTRTRRLARGYPVRQQAGRDQHVDGQRHDRDRQRDPGEFEHGERLVTVGLQQPRHDEVGGRADQRSHAAEDGRKRERHQVA